jgi:hemerythrin superfamily protein
MTESPDVVDLLTADHRAIAALLDELEVAEDPTEIRRLYLQIASELSAHEAAEQQVVFPALAGAEGEPDRVGEHEEINALLEEMRTLAPSGFAFTKRADALVLDIRAHFECEEDYVFPRLRATFSPVRLAELAEEAARAEAGAPAFPAPTSVR